MRSCRRRSCQPEMSDHGCIHLNNFKAAKGIQPYKVIHAYFVTSTSTDARVRKVCSLIVFFSLVQFAVKALGTFRFCSPRRTSFSRSRSLLRSLSRALSLLEELARSSTFYWSFDTSRTILERLTCKLRESPRRGCASVVSQPTLLAGRLKMSTVVIQAALWCSLSIRILQFVSRIL